MKRSLIRRKPRKDPVPRWLPGYLLARDVSCVAPRLAMAHGESIDHCEGRATVEHVKFELRAGKRAPSDKAHTVLLCLHHNTTWALTSEHKEWERQYLLRVEGERAA